MILGLSKSLDKFKELNDGSIIKESSFLTFNNDKKDIKDIDIDSLKNVVNQELKKSWVLIDSTKRKGIVDQILEEAKDTTVTNNNINFNSSIPGLEDFVKHQKKYPKARIDDALDSLQYKKTFFNRFLYTRAKLLNSFFNGEESKEQLESKMLSYGSIALFIFLPFFTLFLKLFYIRRKYTYVDHLIFVFHTQTVFFMLLCIYFLIEICGLKPQLWIFTLLFLLYLYIALRKFYKQGYFKTFIKFCLLNLSYMFIGGIGITLLVLISFAFY